MTVFPSIKPSGRVFTPGEYSNTTFSAYNGWQNRVRHSNAMMSSQVRLSFIALTEADMLAILSHYNGESGTFKSFRLSADAWSGVYDSDYQLAGYQWRYIEPPVVEDVYCDRYNIEVALETVPFNGGSADGGWYVVKATISPGLAITTSGLNQSVTIALRADGFTAIGFDIATTIGFGSSNGIIANISSTFVGGAPGVDGSANGLAESIALSWAGGTATGGTAVFDEGAFWSAWNWQESEPFLFVEGTAEDDAGFAAHLYWTQDLYTDWR